MKLIGEAGGTKIDWRTVEGDTINVLSTGGYNATVSGGMTFQDELLAQLPGVARVEEVYFYAAGIRTTEDAQRVQSDLRQIFPGAEMAVGSDTLAAARGLLGHEAGWIGFIGTGAGMAQYDGESIVQQVPSLGYLLGDEGSAAYFGKQLLRHYLRGTIGEQLKEAITEKLEGIDDALREVYRHTQPQRFLGSLASVLQPESRDREIRAMVEAGFHAFFDAFMPQYDPHARVCITGTVADAHRKQLMEVAERRGLSIANIVKSPIEGLVRFHKASEHPQAR